MKKLFTLLAATTMALGGVAVAQTTTPDETKLKGADRAAAQKQLRDERRAERERNPNAATPAIPATPAVPGDRSTGTATTPAVPATPAVPSSRSTDAGSMGGKGKGGGKP